MEYTLGIEIECQFGLCKGVTYRTNGRKVVEFCRGVFIKKGCYCVNVQKIEVNELNGMARIAIISLSDFILTAAILAIP